MFNFKQFQGKLLHLGTLYIYDASFGLVMLNFHTVI